jgi:hypothetical protein
MAQYKKTDFPIGVKVFAKYDDGISTTNVNFIPTYILEEDDTLIIGTKNDMIGTEKGYFSLISLTGTEQLNSKYLSNVYQKKKG